MRIMGLDLGDATIGVALSDALMMTAQGKITIRRKGLEKDLAALRSLIEENDVKQIVLGFPKNMNNTIGPRAEKSLEFKAILEEQFPGIPVELWDERLTTMAAHRSLIEVDMRRKKRKQVVDQIAAVFILQGYLDCLTKR